MATVAYTKTEVPGGGYVVEWPAMANGDVGQAFEGAAAADRSVHIYGTFGTGGTAVLKGKNASGATYTALTDPQGNAISKTAEAVETVTEITRYVRPEITAGDGSTALSVAMLIRG